MTSTAFRALPSVVDPQTNELIKRGRIKDAGALVSAYQTLFYEDWESSRKRALVQAMADGEAPYSPSREAATGTQGRANINWLGMADALSEAELPYNTLLESLDTFGTAPLREQNLSPETRQRYESIIARELARMIRNWDDFIPMWQQNVHLSVMDGLSFTFFEDEIDWRWQVTGLQFLKFPRRTKASINALDIITCKREMLPHELYRKVEAQDQLPEEHRYWDKDECLKAIKTASPQGLDGTNWEELQRVWKDNDLTYGITNSTIPVIHGFVRELDGTVTHLIARENASNSDSSEFLYKCEGKYKSMSALLTPFYFDVGTNGDFLSIRGLGYKLFSTESGLNRLYNKSLDMMCHAATPHLTAPSDDAITDRSFRPMGPYLILDDGLQFEETKMPDFSTGLGAGIQMLNSLRASKAASYSPVSVAQNNRTQKTARQVQVETSQTATLSSGKFALFMTSWGRQYREIVRRALNPQYQTSDPGGDLVWDMLRRCVAQGVPVDTVRSVDVDAIEVNMGMGKGSNLTRRDNAIELKQLLGPELDQEGNRILNQRIIAAIENPSLARELVPDTPGLRPPVDAQVAQLENSMMAMGQPPAFEPNQDHVVHLDKHLARLYEVNTQLIEQQMSLEDAINQMQPIWEHALEQHLPLVPPENPDHSRFKEDLQQLGEVITNSRKHLDAEAMRAEKEAAEQGEADAIVSEEEGYGGTPATLFASAVDANARASMKDQVIIDQTRQKMNIEARKAQQELQKGDLEIADKTVDLVQKVRSPAKKTNPKAA